MTIKKTALVLILGVVTTVGVLASNLYTDNTSAYSKSNQISDNIFGNYKSMTQTQIQNFINAFPKSCLLSKNYPGGLSPVTFDQPLSYFDYGSDTSPARIIWNVSQFYKINPQVLLTTLEKEQNLVSGNAGCAVWKYNSAMGYNCPDGSENALKDYSDIGIYNTCVAQKSNAGFSRQVNHAAWQLSFDAHRANGDLAWMGDGATYYYGRMTKGWRARVSGGSANYYDGYTVINGESVYLSNGSTAALYNYTPHFTNFDAIFTQWFGSTTGTIEVKGITLENQPFTDNPSTVSFTLKNSTNSTVNLGTLAVAARGPNGTNFDFDSISNVKIGAGKSYTYRKTRLLNGPEGSYDFFIARFDGSNWHYPPFDNFGQTSNGAKSYTLTKQPKLTSSLSLSTSSVHKNENVTASVKVKNYSASTITFGYLAVAVRDSKGKMYDFPLSEKIILTPGQEYTYQKTRSFPATGTYNLFVTSKRDDFGWNDTYPNLNSADLSRKVTIGVKDSVTLTSPLSVTMSDQRAGKTATATFKIKNFSANSVDVGVVAPAVRDYKGTNYDFTPSPYLTLDPGEEYTYSSSRTLPSSATNTIWIVNKRNGYNWSAGYPENETGGMARSQSLALKDTVTLTEPLNISMSDPNAGKTATATFKIKNFGTQSVEVGVMAAAMRDSRGNNVDFNPSPYLALDPGEEYTYSQSRIVPSADKYSAWITNKRNDYNWSSVYPGNEGSGTVRFVTINTKKDVRLTSGLGVTKTDSTYTATFKLKNYGTQSAAIGIVAPAVRSTNNLNYDFNPSPYLTLAPGQEYTYTSSKTLPTGSYNFWITNKRNGYSWSNTYPESEFNTLTRNLTLLVP